MSIGASDPSPAFSSATPLDRVAVDPVPLAPGSDRLVSYEVASTCAHIEEGDFRRIALQFPDELLHDAVPIYQALRARLSGDRELYVLADTTFGSCCVDEVAAEHVNADLVVHYGHACMSPTVRMPVIYVFGKQAFDARHAATELLNVANDDLPDRKAALVMYDVACEHLSGQVRDSLQDQISIPVILSTIKRAAAVQKGKARAEAASETPCARAAGPCACGSHVVHSAVEPTSDEGSQPDETTTLSSRWRIALPPDIRLQDCLIFYLGPESLSLTNLLLTHPALPIYSYSPVAQTARIESHRTNKMLMRRYAASQKARDADVFGIVVGTLGVASYLPLIDHLRAILRRHRKKAYTLAVGKLNPAKLANYQEIECFVLVACGENSLVEGAKDFQRPIVTPFELEVALGIRSWTGADYVLDFDRLLSGLDAEANQNVDIDDPDEPVFSSITGKYRTPKRFGDGRLDAHLGTLSVRDGSRAVVEALGSAAGLHLADRSYTGLDPQYGQHAPAAVEQGRVGLARRYGDDHV